MTKILLILLLTLTTNVFSITYGYGYSHVYSGNSYFYNTPKFSLSKHNNMNNTGEIQNDDSDLAEIVFVIVGVLVLTSFELIWKYNEYTYGKNRLDYSRSKCNMHHFVTFSFLYGHQ